jgi:prepilin-type N-terminal cleavage/methylation domain-containing protein
MSPRHAPPDVVRTRPGRTRSGRTRSGFSLPELLVCCTILGILAAAAAPRLDLVGPRADAGMRLVRSTLQQAQRLAVQHQYDVIVSVDVPNQRLRVAEDSTNDRTIDAGERVRWVPLDEGVRFLAPPAPIPNGVGGAPVAGTLRTVDGMPSVVFHRSGAASGEAEFYLEGRRGSRAQLRAVRVTHTTGRTDWFRLNGTTWVQGDL